MEPRGSNCPHAEGQGAKQKAYFAHEILVFHFFSNSFFLIHLHDVNFNMTLVWMWSLWLSFQKNHKLQGVGILSQDPLDTKIFSSLMLTNLMVEFESCVLNLIWKWFVKDPIKGRLPNFHEFCSEEVYK
jgi:hypothetical protein